MIGFRPHPTLANGGIAIVELQGLGERGMTILTTLPTFSADAFGARVSPVFHPWLHFKRDSSGGRGLAGA